MIELLHWVTTELFGMRDESIAANRNNSKDALENPFRFGALQSDKNPSESRRRLSGHTGFERKQEGGPGFREEPPQAQPYSATL